MRMVIAFLVVFSAGWVFADETTDRVATGKAVYMQTCIACHGANGKGAIPGVADLTKKDGPLSKSDQALITNITDGVQGSGSPLAMPPNGGNPSLTAPDIEAVVAYLRDAFGPK